MRILDSRIGSAQESQAYEILLLHLQKAETVTLFKGFLKSVFLKTSNKGSQ